MKKGFLAILLAVLMALAVMPVTETAVLAADTDEEYVSLPITIRDYAADGMLFEWNDMGHTGDFTKEISAGSTTWKNSTYSYDTDNNGWGATKNYVSVYTSGNKIGTFQWWHCIICNSDGTVKRIIASGTNKNYTVQSGEFAVIANASGSNFSAFSAINDGNKGDYKLSYNSGSKNITISKKTTTAAVTETYHYGNTKGYSLLETSAASHFQGMDIAGTELKNRGKWNQQDTVTGEDYTLNSGAKQTLYGCYIRTNLVEPHLGADGKPVYTEAAVEYIAKYMQTTLTVPWKNSDGTYNMWYIMGTKLFDDSNNYVGSNSSATRDLPEVFRQCITDGLGTYADSAAKTLNEPKDCRTYFDAAYFLLQSLYGDNPGYGETVTEYHQINLVKKGDYYVYNSAYDGSVYDTSNGVIYNSQTDTITKRPDPAYVRGNPQAETRFDPISGKYYGNNGNKYLEVVNPQETDLTHYYSSTNYNMTLEGHAQFVFYEDDNLYFNFTGDDDVYLYINGVRVLDMGGAHAISKCGISLNNVKDLCGLKDGQVYDFDFYYAERHGTAANFGIETNIRIVDPSMMTEKEAYQDGVPVGNYGYVDPNKAVRYQFSLTNNGDAKIEELVFRDSEIGVAMSGDSIALNSETAITDLYAAVTTADGTVKLSYEIGTLTESALMDMLRSGLEIGESISIFGFNYTVPDAKWSGDRFTNTVYTTAISRADNASHKKLNGVASCTVQKQEFIYAGIRYYEWAGRGVTATKEELIEAVKAAGISDPGTEISLCGPNGRTDSSAVNPDAQVTADGILYTGTKTGMDTYYYKVGDYGPVAVTVYSYDVADNVYVLDYSLPVELNGQDFGLTVNDTLKLGENKYATTASVLGPVDGSASESYGSFVFGLDGNGQSVKYVMASFMNGADSVQIQVQVLEDGAAAVTTRTGVVMTETVKVVPANVVYYEDDFAGITYINTDKNGWAHYKTDDSEGSEQSADQNSPYGSDPNYNADKSTEYTEHTLVLDTDDLNAYQQNVIGYLNDKLGYGGDSSNGTLSALVVKETSDVMSFEFRGTGFEIISRTTQNDYAVVSVRVERKNADGSYTVVRQFPVITESKGGDLYQVPIISVTGMDRAEYRVTLRASGSTAAKTRVLYIDGVRIYEPLDEIDAVEYYNPDEAHAKFYEIKSLIGDGKGVYIDISDTDDDVLLVTGTTLIENEDIILSTTEDVNEYLDFGPNNELYLSGDGAANVLALYLYPISGVDESARTIEIGAHRKADYEFGPEPVKLTYGSTAEAILNENNFYTVESGTEQYYEIDPACLTYEEANNRYLLLVGTNDSENWYTALALTNIKLSGYSIGFVEPETKAAAAANAPENSSVLTAFKAFAAHSRSLVQQEPEQPAVNDALVISYAGLKADKIVSGKKATLTVKTTAEAESIVVLDESGNPVELEKTASSEKDGVITFRTAWTVAGSRGEMLCYTVAAYDANGLRSANTMPITVTIK